MGKGDADGWRDRKLSLAFVGSQADVGKPARVLLAIRRIAPRSDLKLWEKKPKSDGSGGNVCTNTRNIGE